MIDQEHDMICRIKRLEDKLLRCKNFQEQIQMSYVLVGYRRQLQEIIRSKQQAYYQ